MLRKVENIEQYFSLIEEAKTAYGVLNCTNIFIFGETLNKFISSKPYYKNVEGGICFYKQLEDMYQMFYAVNKSVRYIETPATNCIVELLGKNKDKMLEECKILEKSGFSFLAINSEIEIDISMIEKMPLSNTPLEKATKKDINNIIDLWKNHLDLKINPLPLIEEILKNIENEEIYILRGKNKEIIGTINIYLQNKICFFERLVIGAQYQSMGIGKKIIEYCLVIPDIKKIKCFVNNNNLKTVNFYKKLGFTYTSKISIQYFKD